MYTDIVPIFTSTYNPREVSNGMKTIKKKRETAPPPCQEVICNYL